MGTIKRFEDIEASKKARELSKLIYEVTKDYLFSKEFGLKNQIRNSSGSIMDNIAEGFERQGRKEFMQFLSIAKGSVGELKSQLYRILDQKFITEEKFSFIYNLTDEVGKMINGLLNYLKSSDLKGIKYKMDTN